MAVSWSNKKITTVLTYIYVTFYHIKIYFKLKISLMAVKISLTMQINGKIYNLDLFV